MMMTTTELTSFPNSSDEMIHQRKYIWSRPNNAEPITGVFLRWNRVSNLEHKIRCRYFTIRPSVCERDLVCVIERGNWERRGSRNGVTGFQLRGEIVNDAGTENWNVVEWISFLMPT
ncbi:hypothetical protein AVEN_176065-1 [Araneus ventricosus]|uniref:Uncharacterized protein n=1 Tax=Araneus ventricosus TaxID=182803 RepID=A0A4Y2F4D8_ARAVE|nr:hypothetical protein AVEN_176065-1 [Araneus ventricosus]